MNTRPWVVPVPAPRRLLNAGLAALDPVLEIERGQRVIAAAPGRVERDLRVWEPDVQFTIAGSVLVLVTERAWFAYVLNGTWPETVSWPVGAVWLELI